MTYVVPAPGLAPAPRTGRRGIDPLYFYVRRNAGGPRRTTSRGRDRCPASTAKVAELVDAPALGAGGVTRGGSNPPFRTSCARLEPAGRRRTQTNATRRADGALRPYV